MPGYFPQHSGTWKLQEPKSFRGISMSTVEMAVITGVVLRVYRAVVLSRGADAGVLYLGTSLALGVILLLGMTTLHLGNYTIRHWLWRAPAFAVTEAIAESLTSLALIALHKEPLGSVRATFADWPALVRDTFGWRVTAIAIFALLLSGVVQLTRFFLLKKEHRAHTFDVVHEHEVERREQKSH
jgi:hypothetical protein